MESIKYYFRSGKMIMQLLLGSLLLLAGSVARGTEQQQEVQYIQNKGQWAASILFQAQLPEGKIFWENGKVTYTLYNLYNFRELSALLHSPASKKGLAGLPETTLGMHAFEIAFNGCNTNARVVTGDLFPFYHNYYLGKDSSRWAGRVAVAHAFTYADYYKDIDMVVYSQGQHPKYDFVVHKGGSVGDIEMQIRGADRIYLKEGRLHIQTSVNELIQDRPYAYQVVKGVKKQVPCSFRLRGDKISFELAQGYDPALDLYIDPTLLFSTFSGCTGVSNLAFTATYDAGGSIYTAGVTYGTGYPVTLGAYDLSFAGITADITISKYDGVSNLLYATYLGGQTDFAPIGFERPVSMYVNSADQMVLLGTANCTDFPVTPGVFDNSYNDFDDLFITIFNPSGTAIVASTYLGGNDVDGYSDRFYFNSGDGPRGELICDAQDNIYVATCSFSNDFPVTPGACQPTLQGSSDAVVFKLSKMLDTLIWSTYLGGSQPFTGGDDAAYSLVLDNQKNVYVTGATTSNNYPTTPGTLHPVFTGGHTKGFVAKISNNGTTLLASSYIGSATAQETQSDFIARDEDGDIYLYGWEQGGNYLVQNAGFSNPNTGMFLHKMNSSLSSTVYATTFGQDTVPNLSPSAFKVDECEQVYVAGWGGSNFFAGTTNGMPVTANAYDAVTDGGDIWVAVFDAGMNNMLYGTFFGGEPWTNADHEHTHGGTSRFAPDGTLYHAVCVNCSGGLVIPYPTTTGAPFAASNPAGCSNAVFKLALPYGGVSAQLQLQATEPPCHIPYTVTFNPAGNASDSAYYLWNFGDGNTLTTVNDSSQTHTYTATGNYTVTLIVVDTTVQCGPPSDTFTLTLNIASGVAVTCSRDTAICSGESVQLWASGNGPHVWSPAATLSCSLCSTPLATPLTDTKYIVSVTDVNGCEGRDSVTVRVWPLPVAVAAPDTTIVKGATVQLHASGGVVYQWLPATGLSCSACPDPIASPEQDRIYCVQVTDQHQCKDTACITIRLEQEKCGVVFMANAFSPNGDGDNDAIFPQGKCIKNVWFSVYDRWGELLYRHNTRGWDGTFKGEPMPIGTYMYYATYVNDSGEAKDMKGDFTLLR